MPKPTHPDGVEFFLIRSGHNIGKYRWRVWSRGRIIGGDERQAYNNRADCLAALKSCFALLGAYLHETI